MLFQNVSGKIFSASSFENDTFECGIEIIFCFPIMNTIMDFISENEEDVILATNIALTLLVIAVLLATGQFVAAKALAMISLDGLAF